MIGLRGECVGVIMRSRVCPNVCVGIVTCCDRLELVSRLVKAVVCGSRGSS